MAGLTTPTYSVEVSFTDPFDTADWVDISSFVRSGTTKRGRQHELQRPIAGTCQLTISNQDGRFSTFNTNSPYINVMTGADSYFADQTIAAAPGTWGNTTNCALSLVANKGFDGYPAMSLTASSAATMSASTATGTSGYAVTAGNVYGFQAQFETAVSARSCAVGVGWYNSGGTLIGSVSYGSGVTDGTSGYTKATLTATAPAGAAFAALFVKVTSPANAEVHYVTRCMISNALGGYVCTAWAPGGRGLVPARPVKVAATWSSTPYPVFYGYVDSWIPNYYSGALSDQVISCTDGMNLLALSYITTSGYEQQVASDGAVAFWYFGDAPGSPQAADSVGSNPLLPLNNLQNTILTFGEAGLLASDTHTAGSFIAGSTITFQPVSHSAFSEANGLSIECMVETTSLTSLGSTQQAVFGATAPGVGYGIYGVSTGTAAWLAGVQHSGSATINDGKPHHLAFTVDASGNWSGYVDGTLDASGTATAPSGTTGLQTGTQNAIGWTGSFTIAALSFTPSALSAPQIAFHASLALHGFAQQQSGQRIAAVLDTLGVPSSLQSLATGISAVQAPLSALTTTPALSYIQQVENTEQGLFFIDESGQYTFLDRHYILQNAAAITSNGTFGPNNFRYLPGIVPGEDALDLWNDWPVSAIANPSLGVTGTLQDAPNTDSIRWYGKRTQQGYSSMLMTTDTEAKSLSEWGIAHYGQPIPRVRSIKLSSTTSAGANLPQMLGRKLWDRITVIWKPIDQTTVDFQQDSLIENIQHDFDGQQWTTTWGLSVAETQAYFTLNDTTLGTLAATGALTGNRLGY